MPEDSQLPPPSPDPEVSSVDATHEDTGSYASEAPEEATLPSDEIDEVPAELRDHPVYQIERELGRGGIGVVYLAHHKVMNIKVAVKLIQSDWVDTPSARERYRREINIAAGLDHPHIVRCRHAEPLGDVFLLVMDYLEGRNLSWVLAKHAPLKVHFVCHYVRQAALGLQHAHNHKLVHRDVKPSNLMLTPRGIVKVLDFGLARQCAAVDGFMTVTDAGGRFLGTAHYVSPEQAINARTADYRSDVYSLGCTMYHLLAGHPPFPGPTSQVLLAHLHQMPMPLHEVRPDVPEELAALVSRMMAKEPDDRIQTAGEVAKLLIPFTAPPPKAKGDTKEKTVVLKKHDSGHVRHTPAPRADKPAKKPTKAQEPAPVERSPARARLLVAGMAVLLCAACLAAFVAFSPRPTGTPMEPPVVQPEPGTVSLKIHPESAGVEVIPDRVVNRKIEEGILTLTLPPGEYTIRVRADAHVTTEKVFVVQPGSQFGPHAIALVAEAPKPVRLLLTCNVPEAEVLLNKVLQPQRTARSGEAVAYEVFDARVGQKIEVVVRHPDYTEDKQHVLLANDRTRLTVSLKKPAVAADQTNERKKDPADDTKKDDPVAEKKVETGKLRLVVKPAGVKISIDGKEVVDKSQYPDKGLEVELAAGSHKVRITRPGRDPKEEYEDLQEEITIVAGEVLNLRRVLLRKDFDYYAKGPDSWQVMQYRDAETGRMQDVPPIDDMSSNSLLLVGPDVAFIRKEVTTPFRKQGDALVKFNAYPARVEECALGHRGLDPKLKDRVLFGRYVGYYKGGVYVPEKQTLMAAVRTGVVFDLRPGDDLSPSKQWDLVKGVSRSTTLVHLPAKRTSPNLQVVFPADVGARARGTRDSATGPFRLAFANDQLPEPITPVAVGDNGSVVYSYKKKDGTLWLAASRCVRPADFDKRYGPVKQYTAPLDVCELVNRGQPLHNQPTLSRERTYVLCPDKVSVEPGKPGTPGRTMIYRVPADKRRVLMQILGEIEMEDATKPNG